VRRPSCALKTRIQIDILSDITNTKFKSNLRSDEGVIGNQVPGSRGILKRPRWAESHARLGLAWRSNFNVEMRLIDESLRLAAPVI
jgi:hypothetical protein